MLLWLQKPTVGINFCFYYDRICRSLLALNPKMPVVQYDKTSRIIYITGRFYASGSHHAEAMKPGPQYLWKCLSRERERRGRRHVGSARQSESHCTNETQNSELRECTHLVRINYRCHIPCLFLLWLATVQNWRIKFSEKSRYVPFPGHNVLSKWMWVSLGEAARKTCSIVAVSQNPSLGRWAT